MVLWRFWEHLEVSAEQVGAKAPGVGEAGQDQLQP